ncbi:hypothetical protein LAZ67_7001638 [Cordylochernes scorpioides]|uniref:Transposase Tc1-like domain-containing protein n=1 Tax=Cordylochernes scorpioides TaxID=51811 RepID=A0ABY6KMW0_9ARAC|nr:hypothetical protein LAZ67_7001638 [Cordylochernes scorpioides]
MPGHRKRMQFKQTDAFTRCMVIGLKRAGWSIRQIAADTHLGASTVHRLWRRWLEQGNVAIYRNVGATRMTSARVDRRILRQAVAAPQATCTAILQHVQDTLDHSISTRTISRRLVANGLHSCRPLRRLPLTPPNRRKRLEWCRARSTWMTEWHRVVFSDESRFSLSSDSRRVRVWRRRGERSNPAAIVERPTGTMTAQRYVDDVLRPVTLPYLQGVPNALYQQDNARPPTARISQQALQDVQMLPWPPYSPDLSPIEHVWNIIGRCLHALTQPRSEDELWQMVEREWRAIPQDAIRTLIDSLPRRVAACIAARETCRLLGRVKSRPGIEHALESFYRTAQSEDPCFTGNNVFVIDWPLAGTVGTVWIIDIDATIGTFWPTERWQHCTRCPPRMREQNKVNVSSLNNEYMDDLKFLDQEVICGHISQVQDHTILNELKARGINLTDICQGEEISIHMLIGSDLLSSILTGRMQILQNGVVATETKLGWTVMGPAIGKDMEDSCLIVNSFHVNSFDVQDLWKLDVLGIMDAAETKSRKDLIEASNTNFKETVKRDESGRYIVSLPWIAGPPPVPVNRRTTENRLLTTTRNVQGKMLHEKYDTIFEEWEKERFIEEFEDKWEGCSYLPHRPVLKDSHTTPIRPVFDASCKKKGLPSLNQCLEKGDNLIELIPDLLLRFRLGKYGIIADMRKAFLQIQVREEDREFLRFLWWKKDQKTLKFYRHCRVVFGLTSSPFLLAATIKYHLSLPQFQDNRCAELLARSFYVDNCILKQDPASILGMKWHLQTDTIAINVQSLKNIDEEKSITKRSILSACHRIFDPIQFTCPATIKIKKMVQDAWKENKSWDEQLNEDRRVEFIKWRKQALELDQIKIPRWILPIKGRATFHLFCDASAIAYAPVIFMRIENASVIVVRFVEARNRLATIKRITIPRLELLACLIGARLLVHVLENLEESPEKIQCWRDSSPALYWIQQQENWAQFVSNREHNPADLPFRGESPSKFTKSGWWEGLKWLQEKKEHWPVSKVQYDLEAIEEERRKTVVAGFVAKKPEENPWYLNLYEGKREVTLTQILRVIAWMLRFKPSEYKGDIISQEELDSAEKSLVKIIQSESIGEEDPKMKQLHAFQDKDGLWRVKTRIVNRNDDELFRLPILIPTNHPVTELIRSQVTSCKQSCLDANVWF